MILRNALMGFANNSTLLPEVPKVGNRVSPSSSLNRDLARTGGWCKRWGMLVISIKKKVLVISRPRTLAPSYSACCWMVLWKKG